MTIDKNVNDEEIKSIEVYNPQERRTTYTDIALILLAAGVIIGSAVVGTMYCNTLEKSLKSQKEGIDRMGEMEYVVQDKDILGTIDKLGIKNKAAYSSSLVDEHILERNHKKDSFIKAGEVIILPYESDAKGK